MTNSELRIPTKNLTVNLCFKAGSTSTVVLHLAEQEQDLVDLLEAEQAFLPVREAGEGEWSIINKSRLLWASIVLVDGRLPIDANLEETPLFDKQVEVRVELEQGDELHGKILYSPPRGQGRVTDHMNRREHFFSLWTSDRVYLVNKSHVVRLIEIAETA